MEGLLELQNEGNELGLVNTGASKSSTEIEGKFQSPRFKTISFGLDPISSDRGVFSGSLGGQPMNIRVLVVDDEPLARVGITTRLSAYSDTLVVGDPRAPAIAMRLEDILKNYPMT